ncbi:MAG: DNA mismatch repair endonuclease MutL, partial [Caldithrix sp.]|nr:DNA mismatch repair endonuclease MutL [Caldithrix sp.]
MTNTKISILSENLANKIAAGEVVERPASVVKELVENAIDAEASRIEIHIEKGGQKRIQVVDNGMGMDADDITLAFERHATSKIQSEKDLHQIETLGFRGEALPSIASVSQIEIKSRIADEKMGSIYHLNGGKDGRLLKTAANTGTSIQVKNLFFNTPARREFLRAESTENQQILTVLKRFFLAYPNIAFELTIDGKNIYSLNSGDPGERAQQVFGDSIYEGLLKTSAELGGAVLNGFISRPDVVRKSRGHQYLFLNGRPINSKSLSHAVFQAYSNLISAGEYPIYCLFLELDPHLVDVNIHPTKMEVRFNNERSLYYFFINTVKKTLNEEGVIPEFSKDSAGMATARQPAEDKPRQIIDELRGRKRSLARYNNGSQLSLTYFEKEPTTSAQQPADQEPLKPEPSPGRLPDIQQTVEVQFWQLHNRYIVSEIKSGMVLIDQHVAHERVLYERVLRVFNAKENSGGQKLLFPQKLNLNYEDFMVFKEIHEVLERIGFSIKRFSGNTIVIEAMPGDVKVGRESQVLLDIIDYYRNEPLHDFNHKEKVAAAFSCKNAIKSGEPMSQREMHNLVDQLFACETPFFC